MLPNPTENEWRAMARLSLNPDWHAVRDYLATSGLKIAFEACVQMDIGICRQTQGRALLIDEFIKVVQEAPKVIERLASLPRQEAMPKSF